MRGSSVKKLGAWSFEVEDNDLEIMEPIIERDPILRDYFSGEVRYFMPPEPVNKLYNSLSGDLRAYSKTVRGFFAISYSKYIIVL